MEQLELEIQDMQASVKPQMKDRLKNYRKELERLRKEFVSSYSQIVGEIVGNGLYNVKGACYLVSRGIITHVCTCRF